MRLASASGWAHLSDVDRAGAELETRYIAEPAKSQPPAQMQDSVGRLLLELPCLATRGRYEVTDNQKLQRLFLIPPEKRNFRA